MNISDNTVTIIMFAIAGFFIMREIFCWYFKINKNIGLLKDIKAELIKLNSGDGVEPVEVKEIPRTMTRGES